MVPDPSKSTPKINIHLLFINYATYYLLSDSPNAINGSSNCSTPIDPVPV